MNRQLSIFSFMVITASLGFGFTSTDKPEGWASQSGGTSGGTGGVEVTVGSMSQLQSEAKSSGKKIILLSKGAYTGKVSLASDKTIVGKEPGVLIKGSVEVSDASNVILRNFAVQGDKCDSYEACKGGADAVGILNNAHNIWLDHLDISDGQDGNCDITKGADFVTVTWCKFRYSYAKEHRFSNLISSADNVAGDKGKLNITYAYCWWADRVDQRQPRGRSGKVHVINNLYTSKDASYACGPGVEIQMLIENNVFNNGGSAIEIFDGSPAPAFKSIGNIGTAKGIDMNQGSVFTPPYTLSLKMNASEVEAKVQPSAGNTLTLGSTAVREMAGSKSSAATGQTLPTAVETAKAMTIGWNIGNSLEAIGGETAWGNPATTQRLIDSVKAAGFNTVRIPCAWDNHADQTTGIIDAAWIARVKEVVDYCINDSMYAILNIHWDNGWLENNCTADKKDAVNAKQKTYWTQIADYFKSYNGRLLFAGANEPNVTDAAQMAVLMSYHQTFIDAVRATGGNNGSRVLLVQGPSTDIEKTNKLMNALPTDKITNRLIVEVHYYSPWNFCGMTKNESWGNMFYFWGKNNRSATNTTYNPTWGEESYLDSCFKLMKTQFIDKGVPVIIGEFGAMKRTTLSGADLSLHSKSRDYYHNYVAHAAVSRGIIPIFWDNGAAENAIFTRTTGAMSDKGTLKALTDGAGVGVNTQEINTTKKGSDTPGPGISLTPLSGACNLIIANPERVKSIAIFDLSGKKVQSLNHSDVRKTMRIGQDLKAGVYIVKLRESGGEWTQFFRITKTR